MLKNLSKILLSTLFVIGVANGSQFTSILDSVNASVTINNGTEVTKTDWTEQELINNAEFITKINITSSHSISDSDLVGIEDFTILKEITLQKNNLVAPDFSKNLLLETIDLSYNKIVDISLPSSLRSLNLFNNQLTHFNFVAQTPGLTYLEISNNIIENINALSFVPNLEYFYAKNIKEGLNHNERNWNLKNFDHLDKLINFDFVLDYNNVVRFTDSTIENIIDNRASEDSHFCREASKGQNGTFFDKYDNYVVAFINICSLNTVAFYASVYDSNSDVLSFWIDLNENGIKDSGETSGNYDYYFWKDNALKVKELHFKEPVASGDNLNRQRSKKLATYFDSNKNMALDNESMTHGISAFKNLEKLTLTTRDMSKENLISSQQPIADFSTLTKLEYFQWQGTSGLSFLNPIANQLKEFSFGPGKGTSEAFIQSSINTIKSMTNLEFLAIDSPSANYITSLTDLSFAPNLRFLHLGSGPEIKNLDFLNGVNLEGLFITYGNYGGIDFNVDISKISTQTNLKVLRLDGINDNMTDISPLDSLEHIGDSISNIDKYIPYRHIDKQSYNRGIHMLNLFADFAVGKVSKAVDFGGYIDIPRNAIKPFSDNSFCSAIGNDSRVCSDGNIFLETLVEYNKNSSDNRHNILIWIDENEDGIKDSAEIKKSYTLELLQDNMLKIKGIYMGHLLSEEYRDTAFEQSIKNRFKNLNKLVNLEELELFMSINPTVEFSGLTNLKSLKIYSANFTDFSNIASLTNLEELLISHGNVRSITTASNTSEITFRKAAEVSLSSTTGKASNPFTLTDYSFLNNLTSLKNLSLSGFSYMGQNLNTLKLDNKPNLRVLNLNSGTTSITNGNYPIQNILNNIPKEIEILALQGLYNTGEADFSGFNNLEYLVLNYSYVSDIKNISQLKEKLRFLGLEGTSTNLRSIRMFSDFALDGPVVNNYFPFSYNRSASTGNIASAERDSLKVIIEAPSSQFTEKAYFGGPFCSISNINNNTNYCVNGNRFLDYIANKEIPVWLDLNNNNIEDPTETYRSYGLTVLEDNIDKIKRIGTRTDYKAGVDIEGYENLKGIDALTNLEHINFNMIYSGSVSTEEIDLDTFPSSLKTIFLQTYSTNLTIKNGSSLNNLEYFKIYKPNILTDNTVVNLSSFSNANLKKFSTIGKIEDDVDCGANLSLGEIKTTGFNVSNFPALNTLEFKFLADLQGDLSKIVSLKTMITRLEDAQKISDFSGLELFSGYIASDFGILDDELGTLTNLKRLNIAATMLGSVSDISGFGGINTLSDLEAILSYDGLITGGLCLNETIYKAIEESGNKVSSESEFCKSSYINQNPLLCEFDNEEILEKFSGLVNIAKTNAILESNKPGRPNEDFIFVWADLNADGYKDVGEVFYPKSFNDIIHLASQSLTIREIFMPDFLGIDSDLYHLFNEEDINNLLNLPSLTKVKIVTKREGDILDLSYLETSNIEDLNIIYTRDITNNVDISSLTKLKRFSIKPGGKPGNRPEMKDGIRVQQLPLLESFVYDNGNSNYAMNPNLSTNPSLTEIYLRFGSKDTEIESTIGGLTNLQKVELIFNGFSKQLSLEPLSFNKNITYLKIVELNPKCSLPSSLDNVANCNGSSYTEPVIKTGDLFLLDKVETLYLQGIFNIEGLSGMTGIGKNTDLRFHNVYISEEEGFENPHLFNSSYIKPLSSSSAFCLSDAMQKLKAINLSAYENACAPGYSYDITNRDYTLTEDEDGAIRVFMPNGETSEFCIESGINLEEYYSLEGSSDLRADLAPYVFVNAADGEINAEISSVTLSADKSDICVTVTKSGQGQEEIKIKFSDLDIENQRNIKFSATSILKGVYADKENVKKPIGSVVKISLFEDATLNGKIDLDRFIAAGTLNIDIQGESPSCLEPILNGSRIKVFGENTLYFKIKCGGLNNVNISIDNENPNDNISGNKYMSKISIEDLDPAIRIMGPDTLKANSSNEAIGNYYMTDSGMVLNNSLISVNPITASISGVVTVDTVNQNEFTIVFNNNGSSSNQAVTIRVINPSNPSLTYIKTVTIEPFKSTNKGSVKAEADKSFLLVSVASAEDNVLVKELKKEGIEAYDFDNIKDTIFYLKDKYFGSESLDKAQVFLKAKKQEKVSDFKALLKEKIYESNNINNLINKDSSYAEEYHSNQRDIEDIK